MEKHLCDQTKPNMGTSNSKSRGLLSGKSKKKGGDDGFIGNRKVRTIILSIILIIVVAMAWPYLLDQQEYYKNWNSGIFSWTCGDLCQDLENAYTISVSGAALIIVSAICAMLLFFIDCDDKIGRITGVLLVIGGALYLIGWVYLTDRLNQFWGDVIPILPQDTQDRYNAQCEL